MGDKSTIEWTEATWNPVVGCSKVSPGCAHCYAEQVHRLRLDGVKGYPSFKPWTPANAAHNVTLLPARLDQPLRWRRPRMVFVNSMSDLFHELVPTEYIDQVFEVMAAAERHTFQVLTKRPDAMRDYMQAGPPGTIETWPPPNVWLGTSIENRRFVGRADDLRATPAAIRFISAEPLLGPLLPPHRVPLHDGREGRAWIDGRSGGLDLTGIDWLIVGGESGKGHRPLDPQWVRDLLEACLAQTRGGGDWDVAPDGSGISHAVYRPRTAFFFKQFGGHTPKAGGRLLDGREWNEMPSVAGVPGPVR